MSEKSALITWTSGAADGAPLILLHDRYLDHDQTDAIGAALAARYRVVSVRSARTQMENTLIKGYYWFLGPFESPELSTFGDGLEHLERLLLTLTEGGRKATIIGLGEGGTMALMLALVWRELVVGVVSVDGPLPSNIADFPLELGSAAGLPMLLAEDTRSLAGTTAALAERSAAVERVAIEADPLPLIEAWLGQLGA